jgi:hypothetical protein
VPWEALKAKYGDLIVRTEPNTAKYMKRGVFLITPSYLLSMLVEAHGTWLAETKTVQSESSVNWDGDVEATVPEDSVKTPVVEWYVDLTSSDEGGAKKKRRIV